MASGAWLMLGGQQQLPICVEQWQPYQPEASHLLTQAYSDFQKNGATDSTKMLLDLEMWTDPPQPYYVYKGTPKEVVNPNAPPEMRGTQVVAGMPVELWQSACKDSKLLPAALKMGSVVPYFYQVHKESVEILIQLEAWMTDASGHALLPNSNPRRRAVIFVQLPQSIFGGDARRFAKKKLTQTFQPIGAAAEDKVTVLEDSEAIPCVYEWWCGPAPPQDKLHNPPEGRWKAYHPQVCRKLEQIYQDVSSGFKSGRPVDVDGVRYMMQHISEDMPYDYAGQPSQEPWMPESCITIKHGCFSETDRVTDNCFVQFRKGNPYRRRPARRRPDATEIARRAVMTGQFCSICLSEEGAMTGCNSAHTICKECLQNSLMSMVGDISQQDNLVCGCFNKKARRALLTLAQMVDVNVQGQLSQQPDNEQRRRELEASISHLRRSFDLGAGPVPNTLFVDKVNQWFHQVFINDKGHLYHVCSHPACANCVQESWILKEDFEREYAARGQIRWKCPKGHWNSVLPAQEELDQMNKNLLLHPEYYVGAAAYDQCPLRRYRLCPECVHGGRLMLAMHDEGCKQWPGYGSGHDHVFCFSCTKKWVANSTNTGTECNHSVRCVDPGVQQVRLLGDGLELGFIEGPAYIQWLGGSTSTCPPTIYPSGREDGLDRQRRLGMTNKSELLAEQVHAV